MRRRTRGSDSNRCRYLPSHAKKANPQKTPGGGREPCPRKSHATARAGSRRRSATADSHDRPQQAAEPVFAPERPSQPRPRFFTAGPQPLAATVRENGGRTKGQRRRALAEAAAPRGAHERPVPEKRRDHCRTRLTPPFAAARSSLCEAVRLDARDRSGRRRRAQGRFSARSATEAGRRLSHSIFPVAFYTLAAKPGGPARSNLRHPSPQGPGPSGSCRR